MLPILTDRREYRELLFDLSDNGRIDNPLIREKAERLLAALAEALV